MRPSLRKARSRSRGPANRLEYRARSRASRQVLPSMLPSGGDCISTANNGLPPRVPLTAADATLDGRIAVSTVACRICCHPVPHASGSKLQKTQELQPTSRPLKEHSGARSPAWSLADLPWPRGGADQRRQRRGPGLGGGLSEGARDAHGASRSVALRAIVGRHAHETGLPRRRRRQSYLIRFAQRPPLPLGRGHIPLSPPGQRREIAARELSPRTTSS